MKYFRLTRKYSIVEHLIVRAGNKSDAKLKAEDDSPSEDIKVIAESGGDSEVYYPDIVEDSALNCEQYFKSEGQDNG